MVEKIVVTGQEVLAGQRASFQAPVTVDLDGNNISVHIHVLAGARPGPTLALLATAHGSEWQNIEVIRRILERLDPSEMNGNLIAVPVSNPVAFGRLTRSTPDESDNADLNRAYPGQHTWIADQLAATITHQVLEQADALLDFHGGMWGAIQGAVMCGTDYPDREVSQRSHALAKAFGWPCICADKMLSRFSKTSLGYFGGVLGRPCIGPEIGGTGFDRSLEETWIKAKLDGTINVMKHLGILDGEFPMPKRVLVYNKRWRVNPSRGGYLLPAVEPERLLTEVQKGELLARIISPYTLKEIERLEAPGHGILSSCTRARPVRPGDWAFGVADLEDPTTRWE